MSALSKRRHVVAALHSAVECTILSGYAMDAANAPPSAEDSGRYSIFAIPSPLDIRHSSFHTAP